MVGTLLGVGLMVTALDILQFTNPYPRTVEYHGLIEIEPEKPAMKAVGKLDRLRVRGQHIGVRKYHRRSSYRERRIQDLKNDTGGMEDRRKGERRRLHLQRETVRISGRYNSEFRNHGLIAWETEQGGLES